MSESLERGWGASSNGIIRTVVKRIMEAKCANTHRRVRQLCDRLLSCWYPAELVTTNPDRSVFLHHLIRFFPSLSTAAAVAVAAFLASGCYYPALPESNFLRRFLQSLLRLPLARRTTFKGSLKSDETCVALERKMSVSKARAVDRNRRLSYQYYEKWRHVETFSMSWKCLAHFARRFAHDWL